MLLKCPECGSVFTDEDGKVYAGQCCPAVATMDYSLDIRRCTGILETMLPLWATTPDPVTLTVDDPELAKRVAAGEVTGFSSPILLKSHAVPVPAPEPTPTYIITVSGGSLTDNSVEALRRWVESMASGEAVPTVLLLEAEQNDVFNKGPPPVVTVHVVAGKESFNVEVQENGEVMFSASLDEIRAKFRKQQ